MSDYTNKIEKTYSLRCKSCGVKLLDPDKKNNQEFFKYQCPSCGFDYAEYKRAQKQGNKKTN